VNCIYGELQAVQGEVASLQAVQLDLVMELETLQADYDQLAIDYSALQSDMMGFATTDDLAQCLTADDVNLEFAAQQGLLSGNFYDLSVVGADFEDGDLEGQDLRGDFSYASMRYANVRGADFYQATLVGTSFFNADLTGAKLSYADMTGANLVGADLTDVDVSGMPIMAEVRWGNTTCRDGTNSDDHGGTCCGHMYWVGVACD
jgi:uncharacterized protein YjbI with pentapeptide repeats